MSVYKWFITSTVIVIGLTWMPSSVYVYSVMKDNVTMIVEVEGNPQKKSDYLAVYYPSVEVVSVYDTLLNGLALQGHPRQLAKIASLDFVKAVHAVETYRPYTIETSSPLDHIRDLQQSYPDAVFPSQINKTPYTGKGVTVGVIDTGIQYDHPDLEKNYIGGYDVVDLDDDPMETTEEEGMPTIHGTHVAGIIGANGMLKGVAPEVNIRAYRALGPGGIGTSIQVIAAMEEAIQDGVDVINLSLGNAVNGPDYPTSIAVNRAIDLGVSVVSANGNDGPDRWTVGAPATASKSLSVGAFREQEMVPYVYDGRRNRSIPISLMVGSISWQLDKAYPVVHTSFDQLEETVHGKIVLIERGETPFYELAKRAEEKGAIAVLIYNDEKGPFLGSVMNGEQPVNIPVAAITKEDGVWLKKQSDAWMDTKYKKMPAGVADFSSRGPVTMNWAIKPDLLAPGTNIISTVSSGYQVLQGTSMAAPHVTGAIALLKEAHPNWSHEQIVGALQTTAEVIYDRNGKPVDPILQGHGLIQPEKALKTDTIIYNSSLSFGKMTNYETTVKCEITIENVANERQTYSFHVPYKQKGLHWNIPQSFTLEKKERKTIPIELKVTSPLVERGIHQGWLTIQAEENTYELPYLFVNETADYPKAMGFEISLEPFSDETYKYQLYITEPVIHLDVELYQEDTLVYEGSLLSTDDLQPGMNEGYIEKKDVQQQPGKYRALITVQLEDGTYNSYETALYINPSLSHTIKSPS
ncbi:MAG TPA: S8 family serine peptidase [Bacillota bacterium]